MSHRYIWTTSCAIEVQADSPEAAYSLIEDTWGDEVWFLMVEGIRVSSPTGEPNVTEPAIERPVVCVCPPGLVERGGFSSYCQVHS